MGRPKFSRKKFDTPLHPWKEERIKSERELIKKYGLKNHREVWKAKTRLKKYRQQARDLSAKVSGGADPQVKRETDQLLLHLTHMSILPQNATLDDVLSLETESMLSRRLQTLVYLKGFSNTVDHARQLIAHGHIAIKGKKVTVPSYMVTKDEETGIEYTHRSPLNELSHPARPKTDVYTTAVSKPESAPAKKEAVAAEEKPVESDKTGDERPEEKPAAEHPEKVSEPIEKPSEKIKKEPVSEEAKEEPSQQPVEPVESEKEAGDQVSEPSAEKPEEPEKRLEEQKDTSPVEETAEQPGSEPVSPGEKPVGKKPSKDKEESEEGKQEGAV
jgi:small subunit ribosomal protein S4